MIVETNGLDIPSHLTPDFFVKVLKNGLKLNTIKIGKISFLMGSSAGDNYCSDIYRVVVDFSHSLSEMKAISLIVKNIPMEGGREVLKEMNVFEKEVFMYFNIVPKLEKMIGNDYTFTPRCYYAEKDPVHVIVFEDLTPLGFEIGDRINGLDEHYSKMLMDKIGKFHAASMKLAQDQPNLMETFDKSVFHINPESTVKQEVCVGNLGTMADIAESWPGYEDIAKKLRQVKEHFNALSMACIDVECAFKVLNHGDLWINNFMFQSEQSLEDIRFIDLQMSYYHSPGLDLNYFLNTSVRLDVLQQSRDDLIETYYSSLKTTLLKLKYDAIPTLEQINTEIKRKEFYGFWAFEAVLPIISLDRESSKDNSLDLFDNPELAQKKRLIMFTVKRVLDTMKYSLPRFNDNGVFDLL